MRLQQMAELQKNGRGRRRLKALVTADKGAKNLIVIQRTFCAAIQKPKHCARDIRHSPMAVRQWRRNKKKGQSTPPARAMACAYRSDLKSNHNRTAACRRIPARRRSFAYELWIMLFKPFPQLGSKVANKSAGSLAGAKALYIVLQHAHDGV
jgi:hypothetical protein